MKTITLNEQKESAIRNAILRRIDVLAENIHNPLCFETQKSFFMIERDELNEVLELLNQ